MGTGRLVALVTVLAGILGIWAAHDEITALAAPNIDGDWRFELVTTDSSYRRFVGLRQVFSVNMRQDKLSLAGDGEIKSDSKTKSMPAGSVELTEINGKLSPTYTNGQILWTSRLHFVSMGKKRQSTGEMLVQWKTSSAMGTFFWNAANSRGTMTASRE